MLKGLLDSTTFENKELIKKTERLLFNLTKGQYNDNYNIYLRLIELNIKQFFDYTDLKNALPELELIVVEENSEVEKNVNFIDRLEKDIGIIKSILYLQDKDVCDYELIIKDIDKTEHHRGMITLALCFTVFLDDKQKTELTIETVVVTDGYCVSPEVIIESESKINGVSIDGTLGTFTPFIKGILTKMIGGESKRVKIYSPDELLKISKALESIEH